MFAFRFPFRRWHLLLLSGLFVAATASAAPNTRTIRLTYETTLTDLKPRETVHLWLPIPPTNDEQEVRIEKTAFSVEAKQTKDATFGNVMFYLTPTADERGQITTQVIYTITRREVCGLTDKNDPTKAERWLQAETLAPKDGKHRQLLVGQKLPTDPTQLGRAMYDLVNGRMRYAKEGTDWGRGDVNWVCDSKFGNCTDFHSLFIALMRSQGIPAKFEIGLSIPTDAMEGEIAGYHCWAKFKPSEKGWLPVDISEANKNPKLRDYYFGNLTADRVTFSTGRDLVLEPKQRGTALNYFVFPYAERNGQPLAATQIKRRLVFQNHKAP